MKIVISLGGSRIVPNKIDVNFLRKFKKIIDKIKKGNKIVIVTGGGSIAREYINALRKEKISDKISGYLGFRVTKVNALLLGAFLGVKAAETLEEVKKEIKKRNLIVCGSLNYNPKGTSDGAASTVAKTINADIFVNITDVKGVYDKDPKLKGAKFISSISFKDFEKMAKKLKYEAGQHFVLGISAARFISKNKIRTIIIKDVKDLINIVKNKKFIGTIIS